MNFNVLFKLRFLPTVFHALQHLGKREHTNQYRDKADASQKICGARRKTDGPAHGVNTYRGQEQAYDSAHDPLEHVAAGNAGNDG